MQIATSSYLGDGTDGRRIVTGASGLARNMQIHQGGLGGNYMFKNDAMGVADGAANGGPVITVGVTFDGADFILDNSLGAFNLATPDTYYWTLWSE